VIEVRASVLARPHNRDGDRCLITVGHRDAWTDR
jgi:hypothetical protein